MLTLLFFIVAVSLVSVLGLINTISIVDVGLLKAHVGTCT